MPVTGGRLCVWLHGNNFDGIAAAPQL
jgi:hypothetical protein